MKTLAGERGTAYTRLRGIIFELWRRCWRARARGLREAASIVVCALGPTLCLYLHNRSMDQAAGVVVVASVSTQTLPGDALWIDARPEAEYRREHVPGALSLNDENWKDALGSVLASWRPSRPVVVYCAEGCSSAEQIARRLSEVGIEPVQIFEGGFERWKHTAR